MLVLEVVVAIFSMTCRAAEPAHMGELEEMLLVEKTYIEHDAASSNQAVPTTRRLQDASNHADVATDIVAVSANVQKDWDHDYEILKPIMRGRGHSVTGATRLCELPGVYCSYGYRRRVTEYAQRLLPSDWIGSSYLLVLQAAHINSDTHVPSQLFDLRRVCYLHLNIQSGPMPAGIERLNGLKVVWISGNGTHGIEGGLPAKFWHMQTSMLLLGNMGETFTGELPEDVPVCDHLHYRLYLFSLSHFGGTINGLRRCKQLRQFDIHSNPKLGGNPWATVFHLGFLPKHIGFSASNFSGEIPFAVSSGSSDPWVSLCKLSRTTSAATQGHFFQIHQRVTGQLPDGFETCLARIDRLDISSSSIEGTLTWDLANTRLTHVVLRENRFTGPFPRMPETIQEIDFSHNNWSGPLVPRTICGSDPQAHPEQHVYKHLKSIDISSNPIGTSVGYLLCVSSFDTLETLKAENCSLSGHVSIADLAKTAPPFKRSGYVKLQGLNLARNSLSSFGFDDQAASPNLCWPSWSAVFPALTRLSLQGCTSLQKVHPEAYLLSTLDVRGCHSLTAAPVVARVESCFSDLWRDASTACAGQWPVCLYPSQSRTLVPNMNGMACASLVSFDVNKATLRSGVFVSPQTFNSSLLCQCPGDLLLTSTGCISKGGAGGGGRDITLLAVIITASTLLIMLWAVCIFQVCKRRLMHVQHEHHCEQSSTTPDVTTIQSDDTQGSLDGMDLAQIIIQGTKEHWVIHPESLELGEFIGKGSFGEVYKALLLGITEVAVKVSDHKTVDVESQIKSLVDELRIFRRIRHPNIVLFNGVSVIWMDAGPVLRMVLEWVNGDDLCKYVRSRRHDGSFGLACQKKMMDSTHFMNECRILIDVARGMQYLHGQNPPILHGNLKPANILIELSEPLKGKIADCGISLLTQQGVTAVACARQYMAPEISLKKPYGMPADVFSFGCVCLFIMLGNNPNPGSELDECEAVQHLVPAQLVEVSRKCLHSEPGMRIDFGDAYKVLRLEDRS